MSETSLAHAWVQQVTRCADTDLPDYVRRGILSCGDPAGELLGELLVEPDTWHTRVAEHAIVLLGLLRHEPSLQHLSDLLWDEPQYEEEVSAALAAFGDEAIPPLVAHLRHGRTEVLDTLVELAAGKQRSDVREVFEELLESSPEEIAAWLADLADPDLLPSMLRALERLDEHNATLRQPIIDLVDAIDVLGGDAGELGEQKMVTVRAARARWLAEMAAGSRSQKKRRRRR